MSVFIGIENPTVPIWLIITITIVPIYCVETDISIKLFVLSLLSVWLKLTEAIQRHSKPTWHGAGLFNALICLVNPFVSVSECI
jgi:hypothetical protein